MLRGNMSRKVSNMRKVLLGLIHHLHKVLRDPVSSIHKGLLSNTHESNHTHKLALLLLLRNLLVQAKQL